MPMSAAQSFPARTSRRHPSRTDLSQATSPASIFPQLSFREGTPLRRQEGLGLIARKHWKTTFSRDSLTQNCVSPQLKIGGHTHNTNRCSALRTRVLEVVRQLLVELGSQGALPLLTLESNLDRDLGSAALSASNSSRAWRRNLAYACRSCRRGSQLRRRPRNLSSTALRPAIHLFKSRRPRFAPR